MPRKRHVRLRGRPRPALRAPLTPEEEQAQTIAQLVALVSGSEVGLPMAPEPLRPADERMREKLAELARKAHPDEEDARAETSPAPHRPRPPFSWI